MHPAVVGAAKALGVEGYDVTEDRRCEVVRTNLEPNPEVLLDIRGVSEWTGLAEKTIRNRLSRGEDLPPVVRLPSLRWRPADVRAWIDAHVEATDEAN